MNWALKTLTLFLPGEGRISPLIVYHVTTSVRNRVKEELAQKKRDAEELRKKKRIQKN